MEFFTTVWTWIADQGPIFVVGATMVWASTIGLILLAATRTGR